MNLGEAYAPKEIEERSVCIDGDIGEVLVGLDVRSTKNLDATVSCIYF